MPKPSAYDTERLAYINQLMDGLHDSLNAVYETLVDRDFEGLNREINQLMSSLRDIKASTEDDI
jgi:hypothetical protein